MDYIAGDAWYLRGEGPHALPPFTLTTALPQAARPEGWLRPVAKPVLDATRVAATEYEGKPAWRIEYPVDTMRNEVQQLTRSMMAPPLRSITIGKEDHLPRAWTGMEDQNPWRATYTWRHAPRPYTADAMAFHPAPGMLEVSWKRASHAKTATFTGNAPDFSLKSAVGRAPIQLSHLRGRPVLLILDVNKAALAAARAFYRDFHGNGLAVLVVTREPSAVRKALPKGGVPFPVLADKGGKVSAPYSAGNADMVLIGKDGRVLAAGTLAEDVSRFRSRLKAMP